MVWRQWREIVKRTRKRNIRRMAKNFMGSKAWQATHKLVIVTYRFLRSFPPEESFSLKSEIQRAAVAVTMNMSKACSFDDVDERLKYLLAAQTAMVELQNALLIARDVTYLKPAYYDEIARQVVAAHTQIVSQIKAAQGIV